VSLSTASRAYRARRDRRQKRGDGHRNSDTWSGLHPALPPGGVRLLEDAGTFALRPREWLTQGGKSWDFLLHDNLNQVASNSLLAGEMSRLLDAAVDSRASVARISPRVRARIHRRCTQTKLEACAKAALGWLSTGGLGGDGRALEEVTLSKRWSAAFRAASRTSPFGFKEDVRGRSRELLDAILSGGASEPIAFEAWPGRHGGYAATKAQAVGLDIVGQRLALPSQAALLPLRPWLSDLTAAKWDTPGDLGVDKAPRAYFAATQKEWRCAVRRMARAGLGVAISASACPPSLAAGAFAVRKDAGADRLIGDRRPQNACEEMPGPVRLPYAPRLRRLRLSAQQCLWAGKRDLSNCFYLFKVDAERLARQVIGPRIPRAWLLDIYNEGLDDVDDFPCWWARDLGAQGATHPDPLDDAVFCQFAITGVMMGDIGAVTVIQEAHSRMLLSSRVLRPSELVGGSPFFGTTPLTGDVYIDDLVLLAVGEACRPPRELVERLARADAVYDKHNLPVKADKSGEPALAASFWGASLRGKEGLLGFSLERRAGLAAATLVGIRSGVSGGELLQLLGVWTFAAGFKREALAILGSAFVLARELPRRTRVVPKGPVLDELLALVGLFPLMDADLRTDSLRDAVGRPLIFATDAEGSGGLGGCEAATDDETWSRLYSLAEERGEYVRLDWADDQPAASGVTDRRAAAAAFSIGSRWRTVFRYPAASCPEVKAGRDPPHINVLELRGILALMQRLAAQGVTDCRLLVLVDSRVCVGALGKGRSSSRRLNHVLRRMAAVGLAAGISLDVVWIPTWSNPADAPSRGSSLYVWRSGVPDVPSLDLLRRTADEASRDMWERILGPSPAMPCWDPEYFVFFPMPPPIAEASDVGRVHANASRPPDADLRSLPKPPGSHTEPPEASRRPPGSLPERPGAIFKGGTPLGREPLSDSESESASRHSGAPPPEIAWVATVSESESAGDVLQPRSPPPSAPPQLEPRHLETAVLPPLPKGAALVCTPCPDARVTKRGPRLTRRERRGEQRYVRHILRRPGRVYDAGGPFLEVFAGTGRLTEAFRRVGCPALDAIDLFKGPRRIDLCNPASFKAVQQEVATKRVRYLHMGTPCTSFSSALRGAARKRSVRDPVGPESDPMIAAANTLVRRTVLLCRLITRLGGYWSIENPGNSLLWRFPEVSALAAEGFYVTYDACAYGAGIPGEGKFRKRTKLLTNLHALRGLERRCSCTTPHVELKGKTRLPTGWVSRTAFASEYARRLVYQWARVVRPVLIPKVSKSLTDWKRLALLACGDVEPNPGPYRTTRGRALPVQDLLVGDVTQLTASRYDKALDEFEQWLGYRSLNIPQVLFQDGIGKLVHLAIDYLRAAFRGSSLTSFGANTFAAALRRYLIIACSLGFFVPDVRGAMQPVWRIIRSWNLALPPEFRNPVPAQVALALATWAWATGKLRFGIMTLLAHHCLLRPEESRSIKLRDIILFLDPNGPSYPGVFGLVGLRTPKTRRNPAHAPQQHVLIEDRTLAFGLHRILSSVPAAARSQPLWMESAADHLRTWREGLRAIGATEHEWVPAGLRGGGATEHYLRHRDLFELRRRGRWTQLTTLDRYLQEGALLLSSRTVSDQYIQQLAALAEPLLLAASSPPPPLHASRR